MARERMIQSHDLLGALEKQLAHKIFMVSKYLVEGQPDLASYGFSSGKMVGIISRVNVCTYQGFSSGRLGSKCRSLHTCKGLAFLHFLGLLPKYPVKLLSLAIIKTAGRIPDTSKLSKPRQLYSQSLMVAFLSVSRLDNF